MANNNRPDYLESLFQGIDIILEKRLDQVSFDTTIICTITDASNSKNGEYRVTDGNVTYKAYSDLDSYVAGQQVRVSVPMGDYTQKKFIVGKYVVDNDSAPITYVSPLESVVNMSGNLVPLNTTAGIKANGTERSVIIWNQRMDQNSYADLQANGIYNTIILKADFKTLLSNYDLVAGTYGLRLDLLVRPSVNSTGRIRRYVELSSKEMFGNPYAFSIFSTQAKTFNISTIGLVEGIELSLYQCGDFKDRKNGPILANTLTDDIIVNNIELGFGSDIVNIDDNIVKIYSENDLSYKYHNPTDDTNLKKIGMLWYNKDDNNQYIGFSDGIYAPKYDELEYLQLARMDTRLLAQKGREGVPTDKQSLTLAANIEEAVPLIQKARDVANQDLYRVLTEFNNKVSKIDPMTTELKKLLLSSSNETYIGYCTEKITENLTGMQEQYSGVLDYGWDRQTDSERKSGWDTVWGTKYYENINTWFKNIRDNVNAVLAEIQKLATTPGKTAEGVEYDYTGYKGVYDIYSIRIQRVLTSMDEYLGVAKDEDGNSSVYNKNFPTDVLNGVDYNLFAGYQTRTEFKTYKEQDLSAYANKYCIYWYRYERDYVSTDIEKLMPDGWRRLTPDELTGDFDDDGINVGLPGEDVENVVDNKTHHLKVSADGTGFFTFSMQPDLNTEKFVALVFYNHNMYKSNELVFTNSDVIPDKTTLDKGDILIFEHGERSSDNFSLYSDLGILMDSADEHYARQIKVHYDGLLAKDEALVGAGVYWYVPNNGDATMLTFDKEYLTNRGFTTDLDLDEDKKPEFSKEGYVCFYKQIEAQKKCSGCNKLFTECSCAEKTAEPYWDFKNGTEFDNRDFWYKIKRIYNESATQNAILCEVRISEDKDPVNGEQLFTFGTAGTNGTKYTLDVVHTSTMVATTPSDKLVLDVFLKDGNGERLPLYTTSTVSTTAGEAYNCEAKWYFRNGADDGLALLETENQATGIEVAKNHFGIIEVTADFAMPVGEVDGDSGDTQKKREIRLDCLQAVPWAAGNYYISGPTQIIYNNYGTLDNMSMFDSPYRLFWERDQKDETGSIINQAHEQVEDVSWRIKYYINNGTNFVELSDVAVSPDSTEEEIKQHNQYELYSKYMPVINDGGGLTPSTLYMANLDCFAVVQGLIGKSIVWEQPIIILQNRYASAMLNSWDGSLTIDEKNGTIMSTMIGAGRKSKNNTFEGVLMGNIALGTGSDIGLENASSTGFLDQTNLGYSNQTGLGLYGFHDGAQSFGFSIDGSAFLGKAGAGRILFNGNYGVIASANWFAGDPTCVDTDGNPNGGGRVGYDTVNKVEGIINTSTAGMCIDLVNGHIDAYDFKLTGSRIHFNSHPEMYDNNPLITGYLMRIGHDGKTRVDYAEGWLNDEQLAERATPGYITMDGKGNLNIRVNSLYITEALGGTNLLQQTSPRQTVPTEIEGSTAEKPLYLRDELGNVIYDWDTSAWLRSTAQITGAMDIGPTNDQKDYVIYVNSGNYNTYQLIQKPATISKYTLSGWVRSDVVNATGTLTLTINNASSTGAIETPYQHEDGSMSIEIADTSAANTNLGSVAFNNNWTYFEYTVAINSQATHLKVEFTGTRNFYLWHAKFEQGSVATTWSPSPEDDNANVINSQNKYDNYLTQDNVFNKLITNPKNNNQMVGIWLVPTEDSHGNRKELYINATYIATGILRSNNWDGELGVTTVTDKVTNTARSTYEITKRPTKGVYWNLNEGKMWAARYELNAWDGSSGIYLNSHPSTSDDPDEAKYNYYMQIGNSTSNIKFSGGGTLSIVMQNNFTLAAGEKNTTDFLGLYSANQSTGTDINDSGPLTTWRIIAGKAFGVTADGHVYASNVDIEGNIKATYITATQGGQIGKWKIGSTSLYCGTSQATATTKLDGSDGSIRGATISGGSITITKENSATSFAVDENGKLSAIGGSIQNLEVTTLLKTSGDLWVTKKMHIGTEASWDFKEQTQQLNVSGGASFTGDVYLSDGKWIYLSSSLKTEGARLNAAGGKQIVITAVTGMWLKSEGQSYDGTSLTGNYGIYLQATGAINLTSKTIAIGNTDKTSTTTIWGNLNIKANTEVTGKMAIGMTLPDDTSYDLQIGGTTQLGGRLSVVVNNKTYSAYASGATQTFQVGTWSPVYLQFANGILVNATNKKGETIVGEGAAGTLLPDLTGNKNKYLRVDSNEEGISWSSVPVMDPYHNVNFVWATTTASSSSNAGAVGWTSLAYLLGAGYSNAGKILVGNAQSTTDYGLTWKSWPIPSSSSTDEGKVLKVNAQGNPYWGTDNNTTYTTATFAAAGHNHDGTYSKTDHTHSGYASSSHTHTSGPSKIELTKTTTTTLYPVVCNSGSPNQLYRYDVTIGTVQSSRRFKHDITTLQDSSILYKLQPVQFKYNENFTINDNLRYGFIAEDVFKVAPELVELDISDSTKCNGLYNSSILALAVAEIQKLRKELDDLKSNLNI